MLSSEFLENAGWGYPSDIFRYEIETDTYHLRIPGYRRGDMQGVITVWRVKVLNGGQAYDVAVFKGDGLDPRSNFYRAFNFMPQWIQESIVLIDVTDGGMVKGVGAKTKDSTIYYLEER